MNTSNSLIRLLLFALALALTVIGATLATRLLVPPAPSPLHNWVLLKNALLPFLLLATYAWSVRRLEHRQPSELAMPKGLKLLAAGTALGIAIISAYVAILWLTGAATLTQGAAFGDGFRLANELLVPWLTAVAEELLFRAVLFRLAEEAFGTTVAVVISAALFGVAHAVNPAATPAALLMLSLGGGTLLAFAYTVTRNLWFPIGLHLGWNLAEGFLYGLPNSGMTDPQQLVHTTLSGSVAWTGGGFGPEGSVVLAVLSVLVAAVMVRSTTRARRWVEMRVQLRGSTAFGSKPGSTLRTVRTE